MKIADLIVERCRTNNKEGLLEDVNRLIAEGGDVNEPHDNDNNRTPLHIAVLRSLHDVAQKLLDNGADVNAIDSYYERTPLVDAIELKNLEMVCMLLCYGADASVFVWQYMTPLMYAIQMEALDIAKVLLDYYHDFSYSDEYGTDVLILATSIKSPFATELVLAGANVNCFNAQRDYTSLTLSLTYDNAELFYLIWPKFDCNILLDRQTPLLETYLDDCCFPFHQWLECLYLLLDSPFGFLLVEQMCNLEDRIKFPRKSFLSELLVFMHVYKVESEDRIKLILTLLSLGYRATFCDFVGAYQCFGYGDEVTALLYIGDNSRQLINVKIHLVPAQILQLFETDNMGILYALRFQILNDMFSDVCKVVKYFSINPHIKSELYQDETMIYNEDAIKISQLVRLTQDLPSLLELCRKKVRSMILNSHTFRLPYQFHDFVNNLELPQPVKDVITFKAPIYRNICFYDVVHGNF